MRLVSDGLLIGVIR